MTTFRSTLAAVLAAALVTGCNQSNNAPADTSTNSDILGTYESIETEGFNLRIVLLINRANATMNEYVNGKPAGGASGSYTFDGTTFRFKDAADYTFTKIGKDFKLQYDLKNPSGFVILQKR